MYISDILLNNPAQPLSNSPMQNEMGCSFVAIIHVKDSYFFDTKYYIDKNCSENKTKKHL